MNMELLRDDFGCVRVRVRVGHSFILCRESFPSSHTMLIATESLKCTGKSKKSLDSCSARFRFPENEASHAKATRG